MATNPTLDAARIKRLAKLTRRLPSSMQRGVREQLGAGIGPGELTVHLAATMQCVLDAQVQDWLEARDRANAIRHEIDELTLKLETLPADADATERALLEKRRRVLETQTASPTAALRALTALADGQRKLLQLVAINKDAGGRDNVTVEMVGEATPVMTAYQRLDGPSIDDPTEEA